MTSADFPTQLRQALSVDLGPEQAARLDTAVRRRVASVPSIWSLPGRRRVLVLAAALLITAPLVAAVSAGIRSTESPRGMESAAAFQAEINAAKAIVPLPAGATWPPYVDVQDWNGSYSTGGGLSQVQDVALCPWLESWLTGQAKPSSDQTEAARSVLLAIPTWEMYRGEFADQSYRTVLDGLVAGVRAGDTRPAKNFVDANCQVAPAK